MTPFRSSYNLRLLREDRRVWAYQLEAMELILPYFSSRRRQSPGTIASKPQMPSIQPEQSALRAGVNASSAVQTEAVQPMVSFLASQSYRRMTVQICTQQIRRKPPKYQMCKIMVLYISWEQRLLIYESYVYPWNERMAILFGTCFLWVQASIYRPQIAPEV